MTFLETWTFSVLLEWPLLLAILFTKKEWQRILIAGAAVTSLTLPWIWFVLPNWLGGDLLMPVGLLAMTVVEALLLSSWLRMDWRRCLVAAVLANLCSCLLADYLFMHWNQWAWPQK